MPTTFTTIFGTAIHGVSINWSNDPKLTGDRTLNMLIYCNMYSFKPTGGL